VGLDSSRHARALKQQRLRVKLTEQLRCCFCAQSWGFHKHTGDAVQFWMKDEKDTLAVAATAEVFDGEAKLPENMHDAEVHVQNKYYM
jgi:hypothetical protein